MVLVSALCAFVITTATIGYTEAQDEDYDYNIDSICPSAECNADLASSCFNDIMQNILCHVGNGRQRRGCDDRTAQDFCDSLDDALDCAANIIDCNCSGDKRANFDAWLQGLLALKDRLCGQDDLTLITNLIDQPRCWNPAKFIECTRTSAGVSHVKDLLYINLDRNECNKVLSAVSACNSNAEKKRCKGTADAVKEGLMAFFQASPCGDACPMTKAAALSAGSMAPGLTVVFTVFVVTVVGIALVLLLMRFRVLTVGVKIK
ncbi:unnamed protein product [Meganyctiphanes norvegica]|uniref:Secreted protein n=1 Tax=Meganyctiphanes norvegica TaxID=48144 RepID=A0AAV2RMW2_MEGNR